eukprot:416983-Lingulodinium_polyedra.AAC.1
MVVARNELHADCEFRLMAGRTDQGEVCACIARLEVAAREEQGFLTWDAQLVWPKAKPGVQGPGVAPL